jgi:hypothetical protein
VKCRITSSIDELSELASSVMEIDVCDMHVMCGYVPCVISIRCADHCCDHVVSAACWSSVWWCITLMSTSVIGRDLNTNTELQWYRIELRHVLGAVREAE